MGRYQIRANGVFEVRGKSSQRLTYTPCQIIAHCRDETSESWGAVLKWLDRDGVIHKQAIPLGRFHEAAGILAGELANMGLAMVPGKERQVMQYFASSQPARRYRATNHTGWQQSGVFVLPTGTLGGIVGGERVILQLERHAPTRVSVRPAGSLEDWQRRIAGRVSGNNLLIFWISAALAAPLLQLLSLEAGGFHLYGATSMGKTTAQQAAASVWGDASDPAEGRPSAYVRRWNLTKNASEGMAEAHNDLPLILDEVSEVDPREFGRMIYQLTGGQGKGRMTRGASLKQVKNWRILLLSTGELPTADVVESEGRYLRGGQAVRLLNIPVTNPNTGTGLIRDTHGAPSAAAYVDSLKRSCSKIYGTAGPAFVSALSGQGLPAVRTELARALLQGTHVLTPQGSSPEVVRAMKRIALVAVAGEKARGLGIVPWKEGEALRAAQIVAKRFLIARRGHGSHTEGVIERIRAFILAHISGRFRNVSDKSSKLSSLAGYYDGETFYFTPDGFKEACAGHNPADAARVLRERGLLRAPDRDHLQERVEIAELGRRVRLYAISRAIVDQDDRTAATT